LKPDAENGSLSAIATTNARRENRYLIRPLAKIEIYTGTLSLTGERESKQYRARKQEVDHTSNRLLTREVLCQVLYQGDAPLIILSGKKIIACECNLSYSLAGQEKSGIISQINLYIFESIVVRHCASTAIIYWRRPALFPFATSSTLS
jgi:hypothetical protein